MIITLRKDGHTSYPCSSYFPSQFFKRGSGHFLPNDFHPFPSLFFFLLRVRRCSEILEKTNQWTGSDLAWCQSHLCGESRLSKRVSVSAVPQDASPNFAGCEEIEAVDIVEILREISKSCVGGSDAGPGVCM